MATTMIKVAFSEQETIRCVAKVDMPEYGLVAGQTFYLARSSKNDGSYYIDRFCERTSRWFCSCPSRKPCRHEKAAGLHARARRLALSAQSSVACSTRQQVVNPPATRADVAPLGGNHGFV